MPKPSEVLIARLAVIRELSQRSGAGWARCDEALKACGGDIEAALQHPAVQDRRRDTTDPFLGCYHNRGGGVGVNHRGQLYHVGCPEAHGERLADPRKRPQINAGGSN